MLDRLLDKGSLVSDSGYFSTIEKTLEAGDQSKTAQSKKKIKEEFTNFIKLLTTNLQHQDPTDPMKVEDFTNQVVQFASVEQSLHTNTLLEQLINENRKTNLDQAAAYIGSKVAVDMGEDEMRGGFAHFKYDLKEDAKDVVVRILDSNGQIVHEEEVKPAEVTQYRDRETGELVPLDKVNQSNNPHIDFIEEKFEMVPKGLRDFTWDGIAVDRNGKKIRLPDQEKFRISVTGKRADGGGLLLDENDFAKFAAQEASAGEIVKGGPLVGYRIEGVVKEVQLNENGQNMLIVKDQNGITKPYRLNQIKNLLSEFSGESAKEKAIAEAKKMLNEELESKPSSEDAKTATEND